ncbi:MAG TPA: helix-turn-helix domain-containing protein [Pyrinomonadaceae bacterium]
MDRRIAFLRQQMSSDLQKRWDVEELSKVVNLSQPHLLNLFKLHIGTSPIHYLRELRLETARELLEISFERVKEIRCKVGMPNAAHFARDFKVKYGLTPTEYRKKVWQEGELNKQK